ncbi:MAG TPA: branched-chain amino acid ABC transporter permease [Chloroflexota bacterium]|nr:branched-chain amino acid ABC transporter permease [Chloroflexota bacterium]
MDFWVVQLVNGVSYGMLLFLVAVGLSLVLGLMGYLNLAHGVFVALGGYIGLTLVKARVDFWLAVLGGALVAMLVAAVLQQVLLGRFHSELTQVLGTFGLILIMMDVVLIVWGGVPETLRLPPVLNTLVPVLEARVPLYRLVLILLGTLVFLGMWWFQEKTPYGAVVRAGLDDRQMVEALGINIGLVAALVFVFGAFLAGAAGAIGAPIIGVHPVVPFDMLLLALVVIVVGGLGSIRGAFVGALIVGLTDNLGRALFPHLAYFTLFAPMALLLVFRPSGLFGRR